jgi:hypothetical protein
VLALEGHRLAGEQAAQDLRRLREPRDPDTRRLERDPRDLVLARRIAGPEPEVEAAVRHLGEIPGLAREDHRVPEVVVEDERPEADARRRIRDHGARRQRSDAARVEMIADVDRREPEVLEARCGGRERVGIALPEDGADHGPAKSGRSNGQTRATQSRSARSSSS